MIRMRQAKSRMFGHSGTAQRIRGKIRSRKSQQTTAGRSPKWHTATLGRSVVRRSQTAIHAMTGTVDVLLAHSLLNGTSSKCALSVEEAMRQFTIYNTTQI